MVKPLRLRHANKICMQNIFVKVHKAEAASLVQFPTWDNIFELWTCRLGDLNGKNINTLQNIVSGMNIGKLSCPTFFLLCVVCIEGKEHRVLFQTKEEGEQPNLWKLCIPNFCGPMSCARYFLILIDVFSQKVWLYVLKSKGDCFEKIKT